MRDRALYKYDNDDGDYNDDDVDDDDDDDDVIFSGLIVCAKQCVRFSRYCRVS